MQIVVNLGPDVEELLRNVVRHKNVDFHRAVNDAIPEPATEPSTSSSPSAYWMCSGAAMLDRCGPELEREVDRLHPHVDRASKQRIMAHPDPRRLWSEANLGQRRELVRLPSSKRGP